ncbi:ActS/PrrB/RegB family redox-sensitive histidine kinase [Aureimonas leprariae]|uniref:histidine kinase n=1 Tax=Plantimonas leprariae TaxID=2615207 RepID=A0A7V7PTF4_9HYPH|nr:ActS/PrrB/RegB family redox-sensitive histidine kinase [Aureimonas leprariae]KAB0682956.1 ActS/PrrB/RegB family redox-sensitive histidine kinase [Aureimonas leprariae]
MEQTANPGFGLRLPAFATGVRDSQRLRLATLTRLRWLSVAGQTAACAFVAWGLWWPYPVFWCLGLIAVSASLNVVLGLITPKSRRLSPGAAAAILTFDIVQPAMLMFITGGLHNPFSVFIMVPAVIASATQPPLTTVALGSLAVACVTVLAFWHLPLPWLPTGGFVLPTAYIGGLWFAIVTTLVFAAIYVYRVAAEGRTFADALTATELVLQREQHLNALDGLAAAAAHELGSPLATISLVAKEMGRTVPADDPQREDVELLIQQSDRCRDILARLSTLSTSSEEHMARLPATSLVEEVVMPHRNFGIAIEVVAKRDGVAEPVMRRNAAVSHGLGNIVENAVDFARTEVRVEVSWGENDIRIRVMDDGPGFPPEVIDRIGDPYMANRGTRGRNGGGGLGLGLFIAKTLLERSGARLEFANRPGGDSGAMATVIWSRTAFAAQAPDNHDESLSADSLDMRGWLHRTQPEQG